MTEANAAKLIDDGIAAHGAGDVTGARAKFENALEQEPDNPEALHLLGLCCELLSERTKAIEYIKRAVEIDPREPLFRMNLASILETTQQYDEALIHINEALKIAPGYSEIWACLGNIELAYGHRDLATKAYQRALEINANNDEALAGYGRTFLNANDISSAKQILQAAWQRAPNSTELLALAIRIAKAESDGRTAIQLIAKWQAMTPEDHGSLKKLAALLFDLGYWQEAKNVFRNAMALTASTANTLATFGQYCTAAHDHDEAIETLEKALALNPASTESLYSLSRVYFFQGNFSKSEQLAEKILEIDPAHGLAIVQLCTLRKGDLPDTLVDSLRGLAADPITPTETAYKIEMALGQINHRRKDFAAAMNAFSRGNQHGKAALTKEGGGFNHEQCRTSTRQLKALFSEPQKPIEAPAAENLPIFVVGMPRSGTTLLESILSANPEVYGAGELTRLPTILSEVYRWAADNKAENIQDADTRQLREWRNMYFSSAPDIGQSTYFVDKQPLNFQAVGLIQFLFPEAKIIHIRRNPVETCFSIFRQPFHREWAFTYSFEDIAYYYGQYASLMAHWETSFENTFSLIQYEQLIDDFHSNAQRIYAHCGLQWKDEYADFHRAARSVTTFSAMQVREPLQTERSTVLEDYGDHLSQLKRELTNAHVDLETGALLAPEPST